ncbi:hypothetical protein JCGZ_04890 [Jatropha curcas]|uniref:Uncharacterized protein n=1 Tax=Jatropha curcas TaxID=180498 RepID=A0A067KQ70_JATCU|nr:hypothetical protein JCGZ_04890 [Jatropha curcas]
MVIQRLEMCMELMKLALDFVFVVAEAIGIVIQQSTSTHSQSLPNHHFAPAVPFVGFLP